MVWALVVIVFNSYQPVTENVGVFSTIDDCFWAREWLLENDLETDADGYPVNSQAVCVHVDLDIINTDIK